MGNLTRDVQLKYTPGGAAVAEVGLAINEKYKAKSGEMVEKCVFVDVTLWNRTAEVCAEYCRKGSAILISGKLSLDSWTDKESGQKRSKLKVVGDAMQLLGSKGDGGSPRQQQEHDNQGGSPDYDAAAGAFPPQGDDGDVPF